MNSHGTAAMAMRELSDVGQRARRRVAYRLLPFVFLLYIVNYIDQPFSRNPVNGGITLK
jgi:hypothetical protein